MSRVCRTMRQKNGGIWLHVNHPYFFFYCTGAPDSVRLSLLKLLELEFSCRTFWAIGGRDPPPRGLTPVCFGASRECFLGFGILHGGTKKDEVSRVEIKNLFSLLACLVFFCFIPVCVSSSSTPLYKNLLFSCSGDSIFYCISQVVKHPATALRQ